MLTKTNNLDTLMDLYYDTKNPEYLKSIMGETKKIASSWVGRHTKMQSGIGFDDFVENIALEFTSQIIHGKIVDNPISIILNIARNGFATSHQNIDRESLSTLEDYLERSEISDLITDILRNLSTKHKHLFLYLVAFPDKLDQIKNLLGNTVEFYTIALQAQRIHRKMKKYETDEVSTPPTIIGNLILLELLFQTHPALLALFVLFKDLDKFLQFCKLFSNETVTIPNFTDLKGLFQTVVELSKNLEEDSLSTSNKNMLQGFVIKNLQTTNCSTMSPILETFCVDSMKSLFKNYDKIQTKLVTDLDVNNFQNVKKVMNLMNDESERHLRLYTEMTEAVRKLGANQ